MNPPTVWNPYRVLDITTPNSYNMFCVGRATSRWNARCRWHIEGATYAEVLSILHEMATRQPSQVGDLLPQLAQLSLCQDWHRGQRYEVVARWTALIRDVAEEFEHTSALQEENGQLRNQLASSHQERERLEQLLKQKRKVSSIEVHELEFSLYWTCSDQPTLVPQTSLRAQLTAEREARAKLEDESNRNAEKLHAGLDHAQTQLASARQTTEQQAGELRTIQEQRTAISAQLSSTQTLLKRIQFELEQNQRIHEEQLAGVLARNAALLEQIRQLEARLSDTVLDRFCRYMKRCTARAAGCMPTLRPTPARWQKVDSDFQLR